MRACVRGVLLAGDARAVGDRLARAARRRRCRRGSYAAGLRVERRRARDHARGVLCRRRLLLAHGDTDGGGRPAQGSCVGVDLLGVRGAAATEPSSQAHGSRVITCHTCMHVRWTLPFGSARCACACAHACTRRMSLGTSVCVAHHVHTCARAYVVARFPARCRCPSQRLPPRLRLSLPSRPTSWTRKPSHPDLPPPELAPPGRASGSPSCAERWMPPSIRSLRTWRKSGAPPQRAKPLLQPRARRMQPHASRRQPHVSRRQPHVSRRQPCVSQAATPRIKAVALCIQATALCIPGCRPLCRRNLRGLANNAWHRVPVVPTVLDDEVEDEA